MMLAITFHHEILRGKGSAYLALREEGAAERYHALLLNAATRSTAFDPQCEGTRAPYIYGLLQLTPDPKPYLAAAIEEFKFASLLRPRTGKENPEESNCYHNTVPNDDDFNFLAELLAHFAADGSYDALRALIAEYDALYQHLLTRATHPDLFFPERDVFECLAVTLCEKQLADPLDLVRDVGRIFDTNPIYRSYDFDMFHDMVGSEHRAKLKALREDSAIAAYLKMFYPEFCRDPENDEKNKAEEECEDLIFEFMPASSGEEYANFTHQPAECKPNTSTDPIEMMKLVDYYQDAHQVEDTLEALAKIRHPELRKWALARLESAPRYLLPIVMKNYEKEDAFEVTYELKQIEVDPHDLNGWHHVHLCLLNMERDGLTPPHEALAFVYRSTYCSHCRKNAIRQLHKAKMLSTEILSEALFDSDLETREIVKSIIHS